MYVSELNFDHPIDIGVLRSALASGFGDFSDVAIVTEMHGGDFPFLARVIQERASGAPSPAQMQLVARSLQAIVVTDDVEAGPLFDVGTRLSALTALQP